MEHTRNRRWPADGSYAHRRVGALFIPVDRPGLMRVVSIRMVRDEARVCERPHAASRRRLRGMTDPLLRHLEDELVRLRRLRDTTLAILRREGLSPEERLLGIEHAFQDERDEDEEAEEARDRERLS